MVFFLLVTGNKQNMKRVIVFVFLILCLVMTNLGKLQRNPLFAIDGVEKVCFISGDSFDAYGVETVKCGELAFNFCSVETARKNLRNFNKNLLGIQFYFSNVQKDDILKSLKSEIVCEEAINKLKVLNCYTPYYQDCIYINGKKVNMQIALSEENIVAGFPVLLTGY